MDETVASEPPFSALYLSHSCKLTELSQKSDTDTCIALCFPDKIEADQDILKGLMNKDVHVSNDGQCPQGQIGSQEALQMLVGSDPSCVERRQGQQTGRGLSTANCMAALLLDKEGCGAHEYYYGIVLTVLGATASEGAVHYHQQTGRASWSNGSRKQFTPLLFSLLELILLYVVRFRQPII
jgi:hypothetical protein